MNLRTDLSVVTDSGIDAALGDAAGRQRVPRRLRPRLGFLGLGWIGRQRMRVLAESGAADVVAFADPSTEALAEAMSCVRGAHCAEDLEALLECDLDGLVIATPSAGHARQAIAALERGVAVFCQKPLACTASEAARVVAAARRADRLLAVDYSYRELAGMARLRERVLGGALGQVFAIDLVFHNAYGPDKPWFYDLEAAGGGCVMDLGTHLIDLAQWLTGQQGVHGLDAQLYARGARLARPVDRIEDYASLQWRTDRGAVVRLACSWHLHAGCDARIGASVHGTRGGVAWRNVDGSFYDFVLEALDGTRSERIASPPDAWGGRALVRWARRLGDGEGFDPAAADCVRTARTVDAIYGR